MIMLGEKVKSRRDPLYRKYPAEKVHGKSLKYNEYE